MRDLTQDSIFQQILRMATPIAAGMVFQTLYLLVDLYFVAQLGGAAVAGVSAAANAVLVVGALTQVLGVGTMALIAHAVGRKDPAQARLVFHQSIALSAAVGLLVLIALFTLAHGYMASATVDRASIRAGETYLYWFAPGLALQFALVTMGSALRGTGIVRPTIVVQVASVGINTVLAPILIAGWGTGHALGVAGAGLASSIAIAAGAMMLWVHFCKAEHYISFDARQCAPQLAVWRRILEIGMPAGGEFAIMFLTVYVTYAVIGVFGAETQAGFGIGLRIVQSVLMPGMAVAFAAGSIAGQNFGARNSDRVKETFRQCLIVTSTLMAAGIAIAQWHPHTLVELFTRDAAVTEVGVTYLRLMSLNLIPQGVIFVCSSMFQGLGNTRPALISSATRLVAFSVPALWLSHQPGFHIEHIWHLFNAVVILQASVSLWLIRVEFHRRLAPLAPRLA